MNRRTNLTKTGQLYISNLFFLIVVTAACQNESKQRNDLSSDSDRDSIANTIATKTLVLPYEVVFNDENASFEVKPNPQNSTVALDKEELAEALNIKYPEIILELGSTKGDTLFVKIPEATYLTQALGTSGARTYLAEATYALTELPDVEVVYFDFKEGDHAIPGYYKRSNFKTVENRSDAF